MPRRKSPGSDIRIYQDYRFEAADGLGVSVSRGGVAAVEGDPGEGDEAEKDCEGGLHGDDEIAECGSLGEECGVVHAGWDEESQTEEHGGLVRADAAVGWDAHGDACQHEADERHEEPVLVKHLLCHGECVELDGELEEVASPQCHCEQQPPAFVLHGSEGGEAFPQAEEKRFYFQDAAVARVCEQPPCQCQCRGKGNPCEGGCQDGQDGIISLRIGADEVDDRLVGYDEGQQGENEHGEEVGEAVGHHRAEHGRELCVAPVGHKSTAPYLAQTGKDKVDGIGAGDAEHKQMEGGGDAYGPELDAPAHGAEKHGRNAESQGKCNPSEVAVVAYDSHHFVEVDVAEHHDEQPHAHHQRDGEFENLAQDAVFAFGSLCVGAGRMLDCHCRRINMAQS